MRVITCMVLVVALSGCSTSAHIYRTDGTIVDGPIVGGDHAVLLVADGAETLRIERSTIADIDHPGNVWVVIGALTSAYALIPIVATLSNLREDTARNEWLIGLSLVGLLGSWGIPSIVWGATTWQESRLRARPGPPPVTISVNPTGVLVTF